MKQTDLNELWEINEEYAKVLDNKLRDEYKQSRRVNFADGVSLLLYYIGFGILITLFQNMTVNALSGKRKYGNNWWISLFGFNIFFFLYFGEQRRFNKYYNKRIADTPIPEFFEEYKKGCERVKLVTENQIDHMKKNCLFTNNYFPNKSFTAIGMIYASSVKARNAFSNIYANVKTVRGGQIATYTKLMNETRAEALKEMILSAVKQYEDFDAIINIRITTTDIAAATSEVMVYGTVIKWDKKAKKAK